MARSDRSDPATPSCQLEPDKGDRNGGSEPRIPDPIAKESVDLPDSRADEGCRSSTPGGIDHTSDSAALSLEAASLESTARQESYDHTDSGQVSSDPVSDVELSGTQLSSVDEISMPAWITSPAKRVTIYDVARVANVSPSTVSRTFSRPGRVNAETAERIRYVAASLGYHTKPIRRLDPAESSHLLAVMVANAHNPLYGQIFSAFQTQAMKAGYTAVAVDCQEDAVLERTLLEHLITVVDGVTLVGSQLPDSAIRQLTKSCPMVLVNRYMGAVSSVISDIFHGVRQIFAVLSEIGHRSVTYIAGPESSWTDGIRWRAIKEQAGDYGLKARRTRHHRPSLEQGGLAARDWLFARTTAVIAFNDIVALGFLKAVQSMGVDVPGDVSVIGIDDTVPAEISSPTLASLAPDAAVIGEKSAQCLVAQLAHRSQPAVHHYVIPMTFKVRDSVGETADASAGKRAASDGRATDA